MSTATIVADPASHLLGDTDGALTFRVRSPEHNGRILRIRSSKCVIGSHPSCTLRLRAAGVRPFHCLILRGTEGMFIRRWSAGTCLNGAGFTDSRLKPGDRLDIGPIALEVLELSRIDDSHAPIEPNSCSPPADFQPPTGTASGKATDSRQAVPPEHDSLQKACPKCLQEREELEEPAKQPDQLPERRPDFQDAIDELRQDLALLKQRHDAQLAEQASLVAESTEATERAALLEVKLRELNQQLKDARTQAEQTAEQLAAQRDGYDQLLAATRAELGQEQQNAKMRSSEWETTRQQLNEQLQQVRQELDDATSQLEASGQQAVTLDAQLHESMRQQQLSAEATAHAEERVRQCEDELAVLRQDVQEQQSQPWQQRQDEWESTRQQLDEQLQQARQELDDANSQLESSRQQSVALEAELQELKQRQEPSADSQEDVAGLLRQREEELAALQREFDEKRQQWRQDGERCNADQQKLREEFEEVSGHCQEAIGNHAAAESRVTELESLLTEASQKLADIAKTGQSAQQQENSAQQQENVAELSEWREVVKSLRNELQQEREQHQCARNEWHADRESIQRELAERSAALEQLQKKNSQEMQEAEFLIHSLQQEGKQLLAQLDEAKQVIRKDIEKHKRTEKSRKNVLPSSDVLPSRCQTMPMPAGLTERDRGVEDPTADVHEPVSKSAAMSDALQAGSADELAANHTMIMNPAELVGHGRSDEPVDEPAETPPVEAAADEELAAPESLHAARTAEEPAIEEPAIEEPPTEELPTEEPPIEEPAIEEPAIESPAVEESGVAASVVEQHAPDQQVIDERTIALDAEALSSYAIASVEQAQVEQQAMQTPMDQAWSMLASAPAEPDSEDEEGVIQRYMERLLKRVATQGKEGVDEPPALNRTALNRKEPARRPADVAVVPSTQAPVMNHAVPVEAVPAHDDDDQVEAAVDANDESPSSTVSRPSTPEMATDLLAMRQLANDSARQAIDSCDQRRFLTVAVSELLVSAVCLASSGLVIAVSPRTLNSQMVGGAIGFSFGCSMFVRGIGKLLNSLRLRRSPPAATDRDEASEL